jgi:hypothetical protein
LRQPLPGGAAARRLLSAATIHRGSFFEFNTDETFDHVRHGPAPRGERAADTELSPIANRSILIFTR